jgi:hypothetical protein
MSEDKTTWKEERIYLVIGFFACIIFVVYIMLFKTRDKTDLKDADLITVSHLTLKESPRYKKIRSNESITLQFICYNKPFYIGNDDISNVSKEQILAEIKAGDTLSAGMIKSEYENINNYSFFDREVDLHSLRKGDKEFLSLSFRNISYYKGYWDVVPALIFAAVMCLFFACLSKKPKFSIILVITIGTLILIILKGKYF